MNLPNILRKRVAPELALLLLCAGIFAAGLVAGMPPTYPDSYSLAPLLGHYLGPVLVAVALKLAFIIVHSLRKRPSKHNNPYLVLKLFPFVAGITFFHFNFKVWAPIIHPANYDAVLYASDLKLQPIVTLFMWVRSSVASLLHMNVDIAYHGLFVLMFFTSMVLHTLRDSEAGQRRLIFGIAAILAVGGVSYWIWPSAGPFVFRGGLSELGRGAQEGMLTLYNQVRATGIRDSGDFVGGLAAMPSLHVAHVLFLCIMMRRVSKILFYVYGAISTWIVIEAVASGWHYVIDLPAGALITFAVVWALPRLFPEPVPAVAVSRSAAAAMPLPVYVRNKLDSNSGCSNAVND